MHKKASFNFSDTEGRNVYETEFVFCIVRCVIDGILGMLMFYSRFGTNFSLIHMAILGHFSSDIVHILNEPHNRSEMLTVERLHDCFTKFCALISWVTLIA